MKLSSDSPLAQELRDPEVREHTVATQIRIGIPFQLRAMREKRGWTQEVMAEKLGTTQNTISRLENPRTGKPTIKTLLRIARVFDVGLLVRFVPFGFYGHVIGAMDATHIEVPSYDDEIHEEKKGQGKVQSIERERANYGDVLERMKAGSQVGLVSDLCAQTVRWSSLGTFVGTKTLSWSKPPKVGLTPAKIGTDGLLGIANQSEQMQMARGIPPNPYHVLRNVHQPGQSFLNFKDAA